MRKRNCRSLAFQIELKGKPDTWQSRQSGSEEVEPKIFSGQDRAEVRKQNFRSLVVRAEWKCGSRILHLLQALTLLIVTSSVEE